MSGWSFAQRASSYTYLSELTLSTVKPMLSIFMSDGYCGRQST